MFLSLYDCELAGLILFFPDMCKEDTIISNRNFLCANEFIILVRRLLPYGYHIILKGKDELLGLNSYHGRDNRLG